MTRLTRAIAPAALIAMIAGAAAGQFTVEAAPTAPTATGSNAARAPQAAGFVQTIVQIENGKRAELRIEDGVIVLVQLDGQDWPSNRVVREADQVLLLTPDGSTVHRFILAPPSPPPAPSAPGHMFVQRAPGARMVNVSPGAPVPPEPPRAFAARAVQAPPPVMLGINFSEPGEALRAQLGLGQTPALLVDSVIDGLPAAKAGLQKHDIILSIDGSDGATGEILLNRLSTAKAGDAVQIVVKRAGTTRTLRAELAAYNPEALSVNITPGVAIPHSGIRITPGSPNELSLDVEIQLDENEAARIERMVRERALDFQRMAEGLRRDASRQLLELREGRLFVHSADEVNKQLEELQQRIARHAPEVQTRFDDRIQAVEHRMEAIERSFEARMDRLAALMDRMVERLEKDTQHKE